MSLQQSRTDVQLNINVDDLPLPKYLGRHQVWKRAPHVLGALFVILPDFAPIQSRRPEDWLGIGQRQTEGQAAEISKIFLQGSPGI